MSASLPVPVNATRLATPRPLYVVLRAGESDAPPLTCEPVGPADLSEAVAEAWRDQCLRHGHLERGLAEVPMTLVPLLRQSRPEGRCRGFAIDVGLPDGRTSRQQFSLASLSGAAGRVRDSLVTSGVLKPGSRTFYEVTARADGPAPVPPRAGQSATFQVQVKSPAPDCLRLPLRPLLQQSTAVDVEDDSDFPVFFTAAALRAAESCSRAGASAVPPVESGGMLVGVLAYCDVAREFFAVVTDVLEINDAEQTTFSLSYSGQSWNRVQAIMKARQAAHPEHKIRLLGQTHGHNFMPHDGNLCDQCDHRPVCELTSVFASSDDRNWMRAVFGRQPWALCQIFGLSARREPVHRLYALKDACWQPRGYFLLPDFDWKSGGQPGFSTPT